MKVTDEMRMLAMAAYGLSRDDYSPDEWPQLCEDWHRALEAALADVPEPEENAVHIAARVALVRARGAEAKLAKVRSMKPARYRSVYVDFRDIEAILDEEP